MAVFAVAIGSGGLFRYLPSSLSTLSWKAFWTVLCLVGLRLAHHLRTSEALGELGLRAPWLPALGAMLLASIPMLATFALTSKPNPNLSLIPALATGVMAPLTEEILFRGYVFLQLYRRARWSFAGSVGITAGVFGIAHLGSLAGKGSVPQILAEVGVVAAGGAFYSWLLVRWRDNLWVPIALHGFMNLWCETFACDENPGNWRTNAGRGLTVLAAIGITVARARRAAPGLVCIGYDRARPR